MTLKTRLAAAVAAFACLAAGSAFAGDVTVQLSGVQARGGAILATLQTKDQFMQARGAYSAVAQVSEAGTVTLVFHDVAPGDYAFMALHDQNGDHRLNMADSGLPSEGVASSGNSRGYPAFDTSKFTVGADGASISASMLYMDGKIPGR